MNETRKITLKDIAFAANVLDHVGFYARKDILPNIPTGCSGDLTRKQLHSYLAGVHPRLSDAEIDVLHGMLDIATDSMRIGEAVASIPADRHADVIQAAAMALIHADWGTSDIHGYLERITLTHLIRARDLILQSYPTRMGPSTSEVCESAHEHICYVGQSNDQIPGVVHWKMIRRQPITMALSATRRIVATAMAYRHELTAVQVLRATARLLGSESTALATTSPDAPVAESSDRLLPLVAVEQQLQKLLVVTRLMSDDPIGEIYDLHRKLIHDRGVPDDTISVTRVSDMIRETLRRSKVMRATARHLCITALDTEATLSFHRDALSDKLDMGSNILSRVFYGIIQNTIPDTITPNELWSVTMIAIAYARKDEGTKDRGLDDVEADFAGYPSPSSLMLLSLIRDHFSKLPSRDDRDGLLKKLGEAAYRRLKALMEGKYNGSISIKDLLGFAFWKETGSFASRQGNVGVSTQPPGYVISAHKALLSVRDASHNYMLAQSPDLVDALETITKYLEVNDLPYSVVFNKNN